MTDKPPVNFLELLDEDISLEETLAFIEDSFEIGGGNAADDDDDETSGTASDHSSSAMTDTDSGRRSSGSSTGVRRLFSFSKTSESPSSPAQSESSDAMPVKPTRAAVRTAQKTASKRPRKQTKTEILKLREQVEELQARFMQLQKLGDSNASKQQADPHAIPKPSPTLRAAATLAARVATEQPPTKKPRTSHVVASIWLDHAVEQYKELQKSESLNRRLKSALLKQVKLSKTLSTLFQKKASLQGYDFLAEMEANNEISQGSKHVMPTLAQKTGQTELQRTMERMYLETDAVCKEICGANGIDSVFSTSQTKNDVVFGPMIELKTNTPVTCDFKELGALFWSRMSASGMGENGSTFNRDRHQEWYGIKNPTGNCDGLRKCIEYPVADEIMQKDVQEMLLHVTLHSPVVGDIDVNGTTAIAKFENDRRMVFVYSSTIGVPGFDLPFHEYGWMVVTDTTPDSEIEKIGAPARAPGALASRSCAFQTFYRLQLDTSQESNALSDGQGASQMAEERKYYQDFVMKSLSNKMRAHQHQIQNLLLIEMETISAGKLPKRCPFGSHKEDTENKCEGQAAMFGNHTLKK
uniref:Uncharacterized protein n=1 Tax=Globisporangium ultimum (strain ATCC 200006 / CBS 805.95 / DAOM BR144) TaxID=431595 RepID=K3W8R6_GLOUD